jgi:CO/xanthine dehydrogenase Mo-binding subunit/aerobic-type carbon monoxide dehydrogenase small subunit (CoxS/CutS family)
MRLHFTVNGKVLDLEVRSDARLLDILRNECGLKGTKEGCSIGECGACSVIMDGKIINSCITYAVLAHDKSILTIEGLGNDGLDPVQQKFIDEGACQCGFCIPGTVMAGRALLNEKSHPTKEEIREGISGNICRCTGYNKMISAVEKASEFARESRSSGPALHTEDDTMVVGTPLKRVDALEKVTGRAKYITDYGFYGLLYGKILTTAHPHALIKRVDASRAQKIPGVHAVLTAKDVPGQNQIGATVPDQPLLVEEKARMAADRIAIIAADTKEIAERAAAEIEVEYELLEGIYSPLDAMKLGAPKIHEKGNILDFRVAGRGNIELGFSESDLMVENVYTTNYQEHLYLESQGVIATVEDDMSVEIRGSIQCPFYAQKFVAQVMGVPLSKVRVIQATTGGGFGGKEDYPSEPAACAALLAWKTKRPVAVFYDREEDIKWSSKRHPAIVRYRSGATRDGILKAAEVETILDAGGYAGLSFVVAERANVSCVGPYKLENAKVNTYTVYTNNLFTGPFRGFGAPQVTVAHEGQMDALAKELGIDPIDFRLKNVLRVGDTTFYDQPLSESVGAEKTLIAARERSHWDIKRKAYREFNQQNFPIKKGIGVSSIIYGCCLAAGGQHLEGSASHVIIHQDASIEVAIGGTEMGQGTLTMGSMLAAQTLGMPIERIHLGLVDTHLIADSGPTVASRTTVMSGNAIMDACAKVKANLLAFAAPYFNTDRREIDIQRDYLVDVRTGKKLMDVPSLVRAAYSSKLNLSESGWYAPKPRVWDREKGQGDAYVIYCYATQIAGVQVDTRTGRVKVTHMTAAHDVGKAINPQMIEGQIEGGIAQGIGLAITENLIVREGKVLNPQFTDYIVPTSEDMPPVDIVLIEEPYSKGPYGAKGIGEPALIPTAAAVVNAINFATDMKFTSIPLTPERILLELEKAGKVFKRHPAILEI